ncbi:MAG: methyltransferase domain-containing protein, partial [Gemmatimonadetes bacterium]|nr:methyltransferase domain-containing protein [Gemmatimonadota bacterium]
MRDVDFQAWAIHILELVELHGFTGDRLLNVACGTGAAEPTWEKEGYQVTGIDQAEEMVAVATQKAGKRSKVRYEAGDMRTLDLGETFDLVTCLYDSLNYLTEPKDVQAFFECAYAHLRPGGGFFFDVATEANIIENFTSTTYAENFDPTFCAAQKPTISACIEREILQNGCAKLALNFWPATKDSPPKAPHRRATGFSLWRRKDESTISPRKSEMSALKVGFIGIGNMGGPMSANLLAAGFPLCVHDGRKQAAESLLERGALWFDSPREIAERVEVICTSLPGPSQME